MHYRQKIPLHVQQDTKSTGGDRARTEGTWKIHKTFMHSGAPEISLDRNLGSNTQQLRPLLNFPGFFLLQSFSSTNTDIESECLNAV